LCLLQSTALGQVDDKFRSKLTEVITAMLKEVWKAECKDPLFIGAADGPQKRLIGNNFWTRVAFKARKELVGVLDWNFEGDAKRCTLTVTPANAAKKYTMNLTPE
jgi:hypothetical protein